MKKSIEILNKIKETKEEMIALKNEGKLDEAMTKVSEIENLKKELKIAEMEEEELVNSIENSNVGEIKDNKPTVKEVMNKILRNRELTEIENAMIEKVGDANGGEFLVPIEQIKRILEYKKSLLPLKDKCDVIPVSSPKGTMPVQLITDDGLLNAEELADIQPSDIKFTELKYGVEDYSDLVFVSNQLLADSVYDITPIINKSFARKSVVTENKAIFSVLDQCTAITGKDSTALNQALNVGLDPANALRAEIITDQDGYNYLDQLTDKVGRPLLTDSLAVPGAKEYKGKVINVVRNGFITRDSKNFKFYVGVVEEAVAFFDREEMTIAVSTDFAFNKRAKAFLVAERFDTQLKDVNGVNVVTIPTNAPTVVNEGTPTATA